MDYLNKQQSRILRGQKPLSGGPASATSARRPLISHLGRFVVTILLLPVRVVRLFAALVLRRPVVCGVVLALVLSPLFFTDRGVISSENGQDGGWLASSRAWAVMRGLFQEDAGLVEDLGKDGTIVRGSLGHAQLGLAEIPSADNTLWLQPQWRRYSVFPGSVASQLGLSFEQPARSLIGAMEPLSAFGSSPGRSLFALQSSRGLKITLTLEDHLQRRAESLLENVNTSVASVVLLEVKTGRILAFADKSSIIRDPLLHAEYPAASLFKIVSTSAAIDLLDAGPETPLRFRGGTYTLNRYNYAPDPRRDVRMMSLEEALAKSCNPAFARLVYDQVEPGALASYANAFGFNVPLEFDLPVSPSSALVPEDLYGLTRTAAGFGEVYLSPLHGALIAAMIGNEGRMPRGAIIEGIEDLDGQSIYDFSPSNLDSTGLSSANAKLLLNMLEKTTTIGTSRTEFLRAGRPLLGSVRVAGKTGTLRGHNPEGIHNWFIGVAPLENPEVAVATLVVHPNQINTRASRLAREMLAEYFKGP